MKKRYIEWSILFAMTVMLLCGCSLEHDYSEQGIFFDTLVSINIYGTKDKTVMEDCLILCEEYEQKFSRTIDTSEISKLNSAKGQWVELSEDTVGLIEEAIEYSEMTEGAFDITVAPLTELWHVNDNEGMIPSKEEIEKAKSHINYKLIEIDGNKVRLKDKEAQIDLGGIAKGYIADKLKALMMERGVKSAMINLGGNIAVIGTKKDGNNWNVGIQKPFADRNEVIGSVSVQDKTIVSSGIYERYFEYKGEIYHHILDPYTGYPTDSDLGAVTIIGESSAIADALSTSCILLGSEKGMELIESIPEVEAVFITRDEKIIKSSGTGFQKISSNTDTNVQ
ncbi:MAG: FAD:protein FMN transferase [Lachnospiraceae bacterium]|nr:FAD:protein FMN transferase [Lachnospiraceae bacterium]